jgi:tetratricopeptide (TPR) repeat protein
VTLATTVQSNATRTVHFIPGVRAGLALALALTLAALQAAPVRADDAVAQELADCQDEAKPAEQRIKICTALIGTPGIDKALKAEALLNRGMARQDADDAAAAIIDYTEAITLNPEYPALYVQRADAYAETEDFALAIEDMTRAIALEADDADHFATRGELHAETGDLALAEADYRKALELEANHAQALAGLKELKK